MTELTFTGPSGAQLVAGTGRPWGVKELEGFEALPAVRSASVARLSRHGSFVGSHRVINRRIRATLVYRPWYAGTAGLAGALAELRTATGIIEETLPSSLDITQLEIPRRVFGRVIDRQVPQDDAWIAGAVVAASVDWECPDPFRYQLPQRTIETGPSVPGTGGLIFPMRFNLTFGTASTGGSLQLTNPGNAPAWPVFEVTGPARAISITEQASGRTLRFDTNFAITAGQVLRIDTGFGDRAVTLAGVSRANALLTRQWFSIPPGGTITVVLAGLDMLGTTRLRAYWYPTEV